MPNLENVLLRDTRANQPAANTVAEGALYFVTDEETLEQSRSGAWVSYGSAGNITATYLTSDDQSADLPNSRRLVAGPNIVLDDTTPNELSIEALVPPIVMIRPINITFDGGNEDIPLGLRVYARIPYTGTIKKWTLLSKVVGALVVDIWKDTYANFPPVVGDSITGASKPTLAAADKNEDSTLTGWTTAITAGDVLGFNVDAVSGISWASLLLEVEVTL